MDCSWLSLLWRWDLPLKVKLFVWLASKGKPLTWDTLRRRGWEGPGLCPLCCCASENINHILVHCSYTQSVWTQVLAQLSLSFSWSGISFSDSYSRWLDSPSAPKSLPAIISWQIWTDRNRATFDSSPPHSHAASLKVLARFHWNLRQLKTSSPKVCDINLLRDYTVVFFDGAAMSGGGNCGAGGIFKTHPNRTTKWFLNCGEGSNNKAELMGLWASLYLASRWSLIHIHVLGDSRLIIDWISHKSKLQSVHYSCWKEKSMALLSSFSDVKFNHISRSFNGEADALSKRALNEVVGRLSVFHMDRGTVSPISSINVFE